MLLNHSVLALLWILYGVLRSVLASVPVKDWFRSRLGSHFKWYRPAYTVFAFVSLVALLAYQVWMPTKKLLPDSTILWTTGIVIAVAGLVIMAICIRKYFMSLSGLRSLFEEGTRPELMIRGIHRYVRHPLYLGTFSFIWGLFMAWPFLSLLICNVVVTAYTLVGIGLEERKLIAEFGENYRSYQGRVPMLIPFSKGSRRAAP